MATAASVFTTPPLRKVFDVTLGTAGTAGGDSNTIAIAHGIDFSDNTALPPTQTEVFQAPFGGSAAAATGAVPYITGIDATNLNIGWGGTHGAGVVRIQVERVHSVQG